MKTSTCAMIALRACMSGRNNRVEYLKELNQQIGYDKIFEEMQKNQLR